MMRSSIPATLLAIAFGGGGLNLMLLLERLVVLIHSRQNSFGLTSLLMAGGERLV